MILSAGISRLAFALVLFFAMLSVSPAKEVPKPISPGKAAPTFSLPSLGGSRQTLSVWCGKLSKPYVNKKPHVVVLSFWATYCKPCRKEIPELMKFAKKHEEEAVKVFAVSLDKEGASIVAPFAKKHGFKLPILLDPYKRTAQRYGVKSLPALVVIDKDGVVRYSSVGYNEDVSFVELLDKALESARKGENFSPEKMREGESVEVQADKDTTSSKKPLPREKWEAVARVECGEPIEDVSADYGVKPEDIKGWYDELKEAAISIWKEKK